MKKAILILLLVLTFLFFQNNNFLLNIRGKLEKMLVIPIKSIGKAKKTLNNNSLQTLSLKEKVRKLEAENKTLRLQLGAIPPLTRLCPAEILWESNTQYFLSFSYDIKTKLIGKAVVWQELFLGYVKRQGKYILVVEKPISSNFTAEGITDSNIQGKVRGEYNQNLLFEVEQENKLSQDNSVYLLDKKNSLKFLLGKIKEIRQDKRLPIKTGLIDYLPLNAQLTTVFVVI